MPAQRTPLRFAAPLVLALASAGCNQTSQTAAPATPPASAYPGAGVTPAGFRLPEGSGCAADVARFRAIQDNDLKSGHVNQTVYDQIKGEIAQADAACAAGRDAESRGLIAASRKRHGYPG